MPEGGDKKGYLLIRDIWAQGTEIIHDMCVVNPNAVSYQSKTPDTFLETDEREKKKKYINACLNESRKFIPFFALVDGLLRVEAEGTLKRISIRLSQKWKEPYSCTCGYVES